MLLLDEPFGALDAQVRRELRRWLRDLHDRAGVTTVFVTHDQEEALGPRRPGGDPEGRRAHPARHAQRGLREPRRSLRLRLPGRRLPAAGRRGGRAADASPTGRPRRPKDAPQGRVEVFFRPDEVMFAPARRRGPGRRGQGGRRARPGRADRVPDRGPAVRARGARPRRPGRRRAGPVAAHQAAAAEGLRRAAIRLAAIAARALDIEAPKSAGRRSKVPWGGRRCAPSHRPPLPRRCRSAARSHRGCARFGRTRRADSQTSACFPPPGAPQKNWGL